MLRLNSPPRCRSSGTGWKLARVRCVAGSNTSLRHLFCKSVVIAHPKRQFLISSIRGEAKKKHNCIDRSFSCFPAHVNEPDRFEPSAPKTRVAQALRLNFGCSAKIVKTNQETIPGFAIVDTSIRASARITPSANAGRRVPTRSRKIPLSAPSTRCGIIRHSRFLRAGQATYHGLKKPKEAFHDAELYRLYHKVSDEIEGRGGKVVRVRLDHEIKRDLYADLARTWQDTQCRLDSEQQ